MVAKLIVASGKSAGRSITIKHGKLLIGRAEECDIRPLGEEVSRRHCAMVEEAGALTVEDLKSRNGTYVNGVRIPAKVIVADGDIVRVGPLELKVSLVSPVPTAAAPDANAAVQPGKSASSTAGSMDEVSRWLMADDEPAGMFDTTRTIRTSDLAAASASVDHQRGDASSVSSVPVGREPGIASGDSSVSAAASPSGIDALIAARSAPSGLPPEARAPKTNNSKDAAAEALKKFFGKR
jgi:pSer/pThr/pTyr-binding forkhead associated (FHA) protein